MPYDMGNNWTVMLPSKVKNQFFNPILQNRTHLKWMKKFVGEDVPLYSIILFSERCELKKVTVTSEDVRVIKRDRTYATVRDIWEKNLDALDDRRIEELYRTLGELTNVDVAVKKAHVENIERKYKVGKADKPVEEKPEQKPKITTDTHINRVY